MKKRIVCLWIAAALLLGLLGACGSAQSAGETSASASEPAVSAEPAPADAIEDPVAEPESAVESALEAEAEPEDIPVEPFVLPIVDEPVTLTYWMRAQPFMGFVQVEDSEMTYWKEMEARTGVKIDLQSAMFFTAQENFQLMIASGAWPDIIECVTEYYTGGGDAAISDGVVLPMDPLLDEYMPNYAQVLQNNVMFDYAVRTRSSGEIYTAGYLLDTYVQNMGLVIRQDWLDQVGMAVPETYDELHKVLTAFQNDLGHSGALWAQPSMTDCWEYGYNVSLWDTNNQDRVVNVVDGEVRYAATSNAALEYLTMMNQWYEEGLIWQDFLTGTSEIDQSLIKNDTVGIWLCTYGADQVGTYTEASDDPDFALSPMPFTKQEKDIGIHVKLAPSYMSGGASISTTSENVEIAARWIDYNYTEDGYLLNNYGVEGEGLAYDENGQPHISELFINDPNYATVQCLVLYSRYGGPAVADVHREHYYYSDAAKHISEVWNQDFDDAYCYPNVNILTQEETEELNNIYADISVIVNEAILSFIVGEKPLGEWDAFVAQVNGMNLERYVEILQTAYDRYQEDLAELED